MKDLRGQMSAELLILFGSLIIILMISIVFIAGEQELNVAMAAARNGAVEGSAVTSTGFYTVGTFGEETLSKKSLGHSYSVDIVNVSYEEQGWDNGYDKKKIQFRVYAKTSDRFTGEERDAIGERINFYLRKSVAVSFNTTGATNRLYNPVFSPHYVYTTANVKWL